MPDINLTFKHGRTQEDARARLAEVVTEVQNKFGGMVKTVEWSADRNSVHIAGDAFVVDARVDPVEVHVVGDIPFLGRLLGGSITSGVKQIVDRTFKKQLPG